MNPQDIIGKKIYFEYHQISESVWNICTGSEVNRKEINDVAYIAVYQSELYVDMLLYQNPDLGFKIYAGTPIITDVIRTTEINNSPAFELSMKDLDIARLSCPGYTFKVLDSCLSILLKYKIATLEAKDTENHTGMVYNPITKRWTFGFC